MTAVESETVNFMETSDTANASGFDLLIWSFQTPNADDVVKNVASKVPSTNWGKAYVPTSEVSRADWRDLRDQYCLEK